MKILEIKGFMNWPQGYEGDHEVERWRIGKGRRSVVRQGALRAMGEGISLAASVEPGDHDLIVCQSFGHAYGDRKGGKAVRLRHWLKAHYELQIIRLVGAIRKRSGAPLAIVDTSDDPSIHPVNVDLLSMADVYFKRELPMDPFYAFESLRRRLTRPSTLYDRARWEPLVGKLRPISLGCREVEPSAADYTGVGDKDWDVFYVGSDHLKPLRRGVRESLERLEERGYRVCAPKESLPVEEYLDRLSRSWLAVSPPGLGWDCHRHYEAALVGTVPVTSFPTIRRHEPFLDGVHSLFYDPEQELVDQLDEMLSDRERLGQIARAAQEHARRHHTHRALFEHVVQTTASLGGDGSSS